MKSVVKLLVMFPCAFLIFVSGCTSIAASMCLHGGSYINDEKTIEKVIIRYRTEQLESQGVQYRLVQTKKGMAIFERSPDGSGSLFETHWTDQDGDHFALWIYIAGGGDQMPGYEFVVPEDRTQNAKLYIYPYGTYLIQVIDGVKRPVPISKANPAKILIPINQ
jgi:hypothetical protein